MFGLALSILYHGSDRSRGEGGGIEKRKRMERGADAGHLNQSLQQARVVRPRGRDEIKFSAPPAVDEEGGPRILGSVTAQLSRRAE